MSAEVHERVPGAVAEPPWEVTGGGLRAVLTHGGGVVSLADDGLELVQHPATAFEPGLVQLWLRDRAGGGRVALLGAGSGSVPVPTPAGVVVRGTTGAGDQREGPERDEPDSGLAWRVELVLGPVDGAWSWHVTVTNTGPAAREVDLVHTHDVGLASSGALRANELYVSQYLDLVPLLHEGGTALAVRQNLPQAGRHPWCVLTCDRRITHWATDALDVHGLTARAPREDARSIPGTADHPGSLDTDLPARRLQHEHTLAALQTERLVLAAGESVEVTFAGLVVPDHPAATGEDDVVHVRAALAAAAEARGTGAVDDASPDAREPGDGDAGRLPVPAAHSVYAPGCEVPTRALTADELDALWPGRRQVVEQVGEEVLSFFTTVDRTGPGGPVGEASDAHVVTRAKELAVLRPHGTILRTGDAAVPDVHGLTVTAWMTGSPLSYLTLGHATTGRVLTTVRGYLNLHRAYGLRLLVEVEGRLRLLDLPSAFEMTLDGARWLYAIPPRGSDPGGMVEVRTTVPAHEHRALLSTTLLEGPERRVVAALHLAGPSDPLPLRPGTLRLEARGDGVVVHVPAVGGTGGHALHVRSQAALDAGDDGLLFDDGRSRDPGVVTLSGALAPDAPVTLDLCVERTGAAVDDGDARTAVRPGPHDGDAWWRRVTRFRVNGGLSVVEPLGASLPWLVRDAFVHHLSPRGLEQYTGGAWGTRDVTQGPLELLLALDRLEDARTLLRQVFAAQNADGSWPQAFGFLPGDEHFRHEPPHGDVVHWPVLALGRFLLAAGDASVLADEVPWYVPDGTATPPASTVLDHVLRALDRARAGFLPGTHLVSYGHGDWNDSLQPADPAMTRTMTSAWTVTLHHQSLTTLADGLEAVDRAVPDGAAGAADRAGGAGPLPGTDLLELAALLRAEAAEVAADLHTHLLVDGELAGYALLAAGTGEDDRVVGPRLLVHPRDEETGLRHGALQMIHALGADLFDTHEAATHVALLREHLSGQDGVRLFDRPPGYHGGLMHHFQRAETATFVGREIGLMYIHAHLRWIEALARWGDAEAVWHAIHQVLPAATPSAVTGGRRRQANTYASSSDAAVLDRADFAERYAEVLAGETGYEGGWRIYSSGPGVLLRVLTHSVVGVRRRGNRVEIDPVLAPELDGLQAFVPLAGRVLRVRFWVESRGHGADGLRIGGRALEGVRVPNPYRPGGLSVAIADLAEAMGDEVTGDGPELEVHVP